MYSNNPDIVEEKNGWFQLEQDQPHMEATSAKCPAWPPTIILAATVVVSRYSLLWIDMEGHC